MPITKLEWKTCIQTFTSLYLSADVEELCSKCNSHPNLASYCPLASVIPNSIGPNRLLHFPGYPADHARRISRLLCGGQGLRAGDPLFPSAPSIRNVCIFCLQQGVKVPETLSHFLHACPLTEPIRRRPDAMLCWSSPEKIAKLHLAFWSMREVKIIRKSLLCMISRREQFLYHLRLRSRADVSELVSRLWRSV